MGGLGATRQFARLFLAPNVGHCGGGTGPTPSAPFQAVVDWVEHGKAPTTLAAELPAKTGVNQSDVAMKRDLCMWPDVPAYDGVGKPTDAASFACQSPQDATTRRALPRRT